MAQRPRSGETYAEYTTLPADHLVQKPESLSHREASALPMAALTADYALFEAGGLTSDETVLIHAAGGVGHLAVQLARHAGATVFGTASGSNQAFLEQLNIDGFVNYRDVKFEDELETMDLVIDAIGGEVLERSIELAKPGGRVITLPQPPTEEHRELARNANVECDFFSITSTATPRQWERLDKLVRDGVLRPTVSHEFSLADAAAAHEELDDGHVRGKLVLDLET